MTGGGPTRTIDTIYCRRPGGVTRGDLTRSGAGWDGRGEQGDGGADDTRAPGLEEVHKFRRAMDA